jgi:hypothetical protein
LHRLTRLKDKNFGLSCNSKQEVKSVLIVIERNLKEGYPTCETLWYIRNDIGEKMEEFVDWAKGVNAVFATISD